MSLPRACLSLLLALALLSRAAAVEQVHLSLAASEAFPGAFAVSFVSDVEAQGGVCYWDVGSPDKVHYVQAEVTRYEHVRWGGEKYVSPFLYHAVIRDAVPGQTYAYRPEVRDASGAGGEEGEVFTTTLPPLAGGHGGDASLGIKLGILGDLGQTGNSTSTVERMKLHEDLAAVILVGDLSYADGYQPRWDRWGRMFQHYFAQTPLISLPGNHEIETDNATLEQFSSYAHRFPMYSDCEDCGGFDDGSWKANMWFSFDLGSAHVIHLSSYHSWDHSAPQYEWLKKDLEGLDRSKTPWVIVNLHAPWYNSNAGHQDEPQIVEVRKSYQPLLCEHKVNLMFAGHVHAYERVHPTCDNSTIDHENGITYINVGDGGNHEGLYDRWLPGEGGQERPLWSAYREASYGFGVLEIFDQYRAMWTWHRNQDESGQEKDTHMIHNIFFPSRVRRH